MKQKFDIALWRKYYDRIKLLSNSLRQLEERPDCEEYIHIEKEIDYLRACNDEYLDNCHFYPREPKWYYDRANENTWASSPKFKFYHLVARKKYVTISL